jgi:outer membrane protein assembly factor BamE (lipoprotein component of BamABCDE complex)
MSDKKKTNEPENKKKDPAALAEALRKNLRRRKIVTKVKKHNFTGIDMRSIVKCIMAMGFAIVVSGCSHFQSEQHRGFAMNDELKQHLKVGEVSAQDLLYYLGSPTMTSDFNGVTYYYVSYNQVSMPLSEPKIKDYKVLALNFDKSMMLANYRFIDEHNMDEIEFNSGKINVTGNKLNPFEQMVKNVGRFQDSAKKGG